MKPTDAAGQPVTGNDYDDGVARPHAGQHHTAEELHNETVDHEHVDINVRAVLASAAALAVITGTVAVLMVGMFKVLERQADANDIEVSPLAVSATEMPGQIVGPAPFGSAPGPQLLTNEYAYLAEHRARESARLSSYAWTDEQAGVARMPIAEAKKLLLERGLPTRPTTAVDPTAGTIRPAMGEASSGRTADGPPRGAGLPDLAPPPPQPSGGQRQKGH